MRKTQSESFDSLYDIDPASGCWNWAGYVLPSGYGQLWAHGKNARAHRFSWQRVNGEIPHGMHVCHSCDNPRCVNPAHLFLGDDKANAEDRNSKQRQPRGERHGSARIDASVVERIRGMAKSGASFSSISRLIGISHSQVSRIANGQHWSHI